MSRGNVEHIRWNCNVSGCWLVKACPDWAVFNNCFPARNNPIHLSDMDGMVEVGSRFLFVEWKTQEGALPDGQRIALERLSLKAGITVLVLYGPNTQNITAWQVIAEGETPKPTKTSLAEVRAWIKDWSAKAERRDQEWGEPL